MFEILSLIGSVLLSVNAIFQFQRSYKERRSLKDLSLAAWVTMEIACMCIFIRMFEIGEWFMVGMEIIHLVLDGITIWWIVRCMKK